MFSAQTGGLASRPAPPPKRQPYYYERLQLNRACDYLFRCRDCRRLQTHAQIFEQEPRGFTKCRCSTRELREVKSITFFEWLRIRLGVIRFPYRTEFLREFSFRRSQVTS